MRKSILYFLILLLVSSCASRPVLYPNKKLKAVGKESAKKDIDRCMEEAEEYLTSGKAKNVAKGAGAGAIIGGAIGAVGGLFTGDVMRGATRGAAMGGAGGAAGGALSPDEVKRRYVNHCLAKKRYRVIGWD